MDHFADHLFYKQALLKSKHPDLSEYAFNCLLLIASGQHSSNHLQAAMRSVGLYPNHYNDVVAVCDELKRRDLIDFRKNEAESPNGELHGLTIWTMEAWKLIGSVKRIARRMQLKLISREDLKITLL